VQGFAGSAIGSLGGYIAGESGLVGSYGDGIEANKLARAIISGAAGCAGAVLSGGKCAQAAVTAAFASLYNSDGPRDARNEAEEQWYEKINKQHAEGVAQVANELRRAGWQIISQSGYDAAYTYDPTGLLVHPRYYDIIAYDRTNQLYAGIEVKTTTRLEYPLEGNQVWKDIFTAQFGARVPGLGLDITAVSYIGVQTCSACRSEARFQSGRLRDGLAGAGIPMNTTPKTCSPGKPC
jgi:hypothetical protein